MKKLTRILTMGGFGLLAALATGAGPANASTTTHAAPESKTVAKQIQWRSGDDIVGYYRNLRDCELAGQFGERAGDWDDHNCSAVRVGLRSGAWALQVASDDDWDRVGFGVPFRAINGFPGHFRPVWAGSFRGGSGHGRPGGGHDDHRSGHDNHRGGHDNHRGGGGGRPHKG